MTVLALDGGENIGWAIFIDRGTDVNRGVIRQEVFFSPQHRPWDISYDTLWFKQWNVSDIVVEGIRHNPNISQGGSQRWESQVEGAVRMLGAIAPVKIHVQQPAILPVALMHEEMEWPKTKTGKKKHLPDDLSAWLHGRYFLRSIGVLE